MRYFILIILSCGFEFGRSFPAILHTGSLTDSVQVKKVTAYVSAHPDEMKSFWMVKELAFTEDYEVVKPLYTRLQSNIKQSPVAVKFSRQLEGMKNVKIGNEAPAFTAADTSGRKLSLSQFRGKYVLLDFWASWCVPCRNANPELVKIYQEFKNKGLVIVSVSLDKKRSYWVKAIQNDGLTWYQVSDLKYWDNQVARLYGISAIPQKFLIDPSGKLIAKNLKGLALQTKLQKLINKANPAKSE